GSQSSDPTGALSLYTWSWGDATSTALSSPTASHTYATVGTYGISLTVTDNGGAIATSTTSATVAPRPNAAPVAKDDSATVTRRQSVAIAVLQNDSDA